MSIPKHKWQFTARLRRGAFGWRGSSLAARRLQEAVSEIRKVERNDPILAAEGAVRLIERLWPALEHIDTSYGALGAVVGQTVHQVLEYPIAAEVNSSTRDKWLKRMWKALLEDGVDYTMEVADRWGELCGSNKVREQWLEILLPDLRRSWSKESSGYYRGTSACLSCLMSLGKYEELLELLDNPSAGLWHYRRYGVDALLVMGRPEEALEYAEASRGPYVIDWRLDLKCESILLDQGRREEAYERYGLRIHERNSGLATFRAIVKRYPEKEEGEVLNDLIKADPTAEHKWFATARKLGFLELAVRLAQTSQCDPRTLNRAARDLAQKEPAVALEIALASLKLMGEGTKYEITGIDIQAACSFAMEAGRALGKPEDVARRVGVLGETYPSIWDVCQKCIA